MNNISAAAYHAFPTLQPITSPRPEHWHLRIRLREELRERGIRVMALVPGATDTDIWQQFWPDAPREKMVSPRRCRSRTVAALRVTPWAPSMRSNRPSEWTAIVLPVEVPVSPWA